VNEVSVEDQIVREPDEVDGLDRRHFLLQVVQAKHDLIIEEHIARGRLVKKIGNEPVVENLVQKGVIDRLQSDIDRLHELFGVDEIGVYSRLPVLFQQKLPEHIENKGKQEKQNRNIGPDHPAEPGMSHGIPSSSRDERLKKDKSGGNLRFCLYFRASLMSFP
jgi:hypothetical protein